MVTSTNPPKSVNIKDLASLPTGQNATIVAINTDQELHGRLMGLGLFVGSEIRLLQGGNGRSGPLLLGIGNTRIAIGRDIAHTILVENPTT